MALRDRDLVPSPQKKKSKKSIALAVFLGVLAAIVMRQLVHAFWFFPITIPSNHMSPAIEPDSSVYVNRRVKPEEIKRGDLLLLDHPLAGDLQMIRRVIALPGERVRLENGRVLINDRELDAEWEQALQKKSALNRNTPAHIYGESNAPEMTVKAGHLYVLADNRTAALDSRQLGQFPFRCIRGRIHDFF